MSLVRQQLEELYHQSYQAPQRAILSHCPVKTITIFFFFLNHRFLIQGVFSAFYQYLMYLLVHISYFHCLMLIVKIKTFIVSQNKKPKPSK